MEFPKYELDISSYLNKIKSLLHDDNCHIFIDTNIISQLYRLNDKAREDFYDWVNEYTNRFHVPIWAIHEYSNRVNGNNTKDYLSELSKIKTYSKDINSISGFIKGYVGDSMLIGSSYQDKRDELFKDIDKVNALLTKIYPAISNKLNEHQASVHKEIVEKLSPHTLSSNIYDMMNNTKYEFENRVSGRVPPGFKDAKKEENANGDLIIWQEILSFCETCNSDNQKVKAILITRDNKPDMVYSPVNQINDGRPANEKEKLSIAHESLVYEFKLKTSSIGFYIINFNSLVKILAPEYRELARSFQIATAEENTNNENETVINQESIIDDSNDENISTDVNSTIPESKESNTEIENLDDDVLYSGTALMDAQYDYLNGDGFVDGYIEKLKTYNWYEQNPAIDKLINLKTNGVKDDLINRSSFFVLGRNIMQSAEGSSGSAISFIENISYFTKSWSKVFVKSLIDGCLFEIFFDSSGAVRPYGFKGTYSSDLYSSINALSLDNPFDFINNKLQKSGNKRFKPKVGSNQIYSFRFEFQENLMTNDVYCNGVNISSTFKPTLYLSEFAKKDYLEKALSSYYAISQDYIDIEQPLPVDLKTIYYIVDNNEDIDFLPF